MRTLLVLGLMLMSGCAYSDEASTEPSVSMSVQRRDNNGMRSVEAVLTGVSGPIDDWSDLRVVGCQAPASGPIEVPHTFSGCAWDIRIRYAATGQTLYST